MYQGNQNAGYSSTLEYPYRAGCTLVGGTASGTDPNKVCVGAVTCPEPATNPTVPYVYFSNDQLCERNVSETFKLTLTPDKATIEPGKSYTFTATVTNQDGNPPTISVPVNVKVEVDPTSGGHDHGETYANRNKGSISPTNGTTSFPITFTATEVSGTHTITATCDLCTNGPQTAKVDVKVEGLEPIPSSQFYSLTEPIAGGGTKPVGATDEHAKNHYLTPAAAAVLWRMASAYYFEARFAILDKALNRRISPPLLYLNDASLGWGGKFDIAGTWGGEHSEHRRGTVIDIRANPYGYMTMPIANFAKFEDLAVNTLTNDVSADARIHCTKDKKSTPKAQRHNRSAPECISQLDGSQDNNRHFHVRLMGASE
jgi:hypothetical protein